MKAKCSSEYCQRESVFTCDFPMRVACCDADLCAVCATRRGPHFALCPAHRHWHEPRLPRRLPTHYRPPTPKDETWD